MGFKLFTCRSSLETAGDCSASAVCLVSAAAGHFGALWLFPDGRSLRLRARYGLWCFVLEAKNAVFVHHH